MSTTQAQGGLGRYLTVYVSTLIIAAIEVGIAYRHPGGTQLLVSMLSFASIGAILVVLFFMRLAAEKHSLLMAFAIFTLFMLATINYGWTDSMRILHGAPFAK
jgi:heme/copper-type cytochrome/quinol oxidase subunit 4